VDQGLDERDGSQPGRARGELGAGLQPGTQPRQAVEPPLYPRPVDVMSHPRPVDVMSHPRQTASVTRPSRERDLCRYGLRELPRSR